MHMKNTIADVLAGRKTW